MGEGIGGGCISLLLCFWRPLASKMLRGLVKGFVKGETSLPPAGSVWSGKWL